MAEEKQINGIERMNSGGLRIGVDIDEVVVEFVKEVLVYLEKKKGKNVKYEDVYNYDFRGPFGMNQEDVDKLIKDFFSEYKFDSDFDFVKGSKESINFLKNYNNILFITSRPLFCKEETLNFLNKNFPGNDFEVVFSSEAWNCNSKDAKTKNQICVDLSTDLIIEDNANYAVDCANSDIFVLLFDKPWNQDLDDKKYDNIYRVSGWEEALEKIKEIGDKINNFQKVEEKNVR